MKRSLTKTIFDGSNGMPNLFKIHTDHGILNAPTTQIQLHQLQ